jgi:hypothetical protein
MAYENGTITAPVSVHDVNAALGAASTDVGTLCSHSNIKIRAKYKPVRWSIVSRNRDDVNGWTVLVNDDKHDYWRGNDGMCGINFPIYTTADAITTAIKNGNVGTFELLPLGIVGSEKYPYRLADFDGYKHIPSDGADISSFISVVHGTELETNGSFIVHIQQNNTKDEAFINLNDLAVPQGMSGGNSTVDVPFSKFYYVVYLFNSTNTYEVTSEKTLDDLDYRQDFAELTLQPKEGTYKLAVFCKYPIEENIALCVPLGYLSKDFTIVKATRKIYARVYEMFLADRQAETTLKLYFGFGNASGAQCVVGVSEVRIYGGDFDNGNNLLYYNNSNVTSTGDITLAKGTWDNPSGASVLYTKREQWSAGEYTITASLKLGTETILGTIKLTIGTMTPSNGNAYPYVKTYHADFCYPDEIEDLIPDEY